MMWDKSEENASEEFWSSQPIPEKGRNRTFQEFRRVSVLYGEVKYHAFYTGYSIQAEYQQTICHVSIIPKEVNDFWNSLLCSVGLRWRESSGRSIELIRPLLFIEPSHRKVLSDHNSVSHAIFMYRSSRASILSKLK